MKTARHLLHTPGFAIVAIIAIALGIGTVTTMLAIFDALFLRPIPGITDIDRFVRVRAYFSNDPDLMGGMSQPLTDDVRAGSGSVEGVFLTMARTVIFGDPVRPVRALGSDVTADAFRTLGAQPILGRLFTEEEEISSAKVAILSHDLWRKEFHHDRDVIGRDLVLNGTPTKIIGVMPPGFRFPDQSDLWTPWRDDKGEPDKTRINLSYPAWARLAPDITLAQAQAELDGLALKLAAQHPETDKNIRFRLTEFRSIDSSENRTALVLNLFAVLAVQAIACTNVANLLLARGATRFREMTIRSALGANRARLTWQMLGESFVLGAVGSIIGVLASYWIIDWISLIIPSDLPSWLRFTVDSRVLVFSTVAALVSTLLFGLFPAIRLSKIDLHAGLKESARGMTDSRFAAKLRAHLLRDQLALAVILLVFAGLAIRGFLRQQNRPPGIDPKNVFTFRVGLPPSQFKENTIQPQFFNTLVPELAKIPGVETAALVDSLPMTSMVQNSIFIREGIPEAKSIADELVANKRTVTPGFFAVLKIPLLQGRIFDARDTGKDASVAIVDEAFARELYPNGDALGKKIAWPKHEDSKEPVKWMTIIGVVGTINPTPSQNLPPRSIWEPILQEKTDNFYTGVLRVRPGIDPASLSGPVQEAVLRVRQGVPIYNTRTMADIYSAAYWERRLFTIVMGMFAATGLLLAAVGIYSSMVYHVSQRRREIGVRIALGADPRHVFAMLMKHGARMIIEGLGIGLGVAYVIAWLLASHLGNLITNDGLTYAVVVVVLTLTALIACWLPSRKGTAIQPMEALRAE